MLTILYTAIAVTPTTDQCATDLPDTATEMEA